MRTKVGYSYTGNNDMYGISLDIEVIKPLSQKFSFGLHLGSQSFATKTSGVIAKGDVKIFDADAITLGILSQVRLLTINNVDVHFSGYVLGKYWDDIDILVRKDIDTGNERMINNSIQYLSFAPGISLGADIQLTKSIAFHLSGSFQQDYKANNSRSIVNISTGLVFYL